MDLNSTRTAANTITPEVEQPKPKYGERLLDYYAKKGDSLVEEYKDPTRLAQLAYTKASDRDAMDYDTWSAYHGINDFIEKAPTIAATRKEQTAFDEAKPADRGFLAGTAAALGRGAMSAVGAVGQTMGLADLTPASIDTDKGYLDRAGESLVNWSEDKKASTQFMRPTVAEETDANSAVKKAWEGGVESMVTSAAPMAAGYAGMKAGGAAGAAVGSMFGPAGTAAGAAIGGTIGGLGAYGLARFGMFGAGVYGDTYDKTYAELKQKNPGMAEEEVRRVANKGAWIDSISENVSEAVGDAAAYFTFGGTKVLQQPLTASIKDVMKRGIKGIAADVAKQMPFEVGSEVANAAVGAQWRQDAGLDGGDMQTAMVDAIGPAVVMSLLMGGGVAGYTEVKARKALNDINSADPDVRAKTATEITGQILERTKDEELAQTWNKEAFASIEAGEPIKIDEQLAKFGANKARIDAVDNGEDVAVIPDESEIAAEVEAPLSPAESMLTDGVKTTPEALLMGGDAQVVEQDAPSAILDQEIAASSPEVGSMADESVQNMQQVAEPSLQAQQSEAAPMEILPAFLNGLSPEDQATEIRRRIANIEGVTKRSRTQSENLGMYRSLLSKIEANAPELPASSQTVGNITAEQAQPVQAEAPDLNAEWSARADEQQVAAQGRMLDAEWTKRQAEMEARAADLRKRAANLTAPEGKKNSPAREAKLQEVQTELQQVEAEQLSPAPSPTVAPPSAMDEGAIPEIKTELDAIAHEAATSPLNGLPEPTQAQKEAGNYKKAHVRVNGLDFSIENPKGSERKGVDKDGTPWSTTMRNHYSYIKGSIGADKDHVDAFLSDAPESGRVFIVDQIDPKTGAFDEHKAMVGFETEDQAREAYLSNYSEGWQGLGAITPMEHADFKKWVFSKKTKRPVGDISKADRPSAETVTAPSQGEASPKEPWQMTREEWNSGESRVLSDQESAGIIGKEANSTIIEYGDFNGATAYRKQKIENGRRVPDGPWVIYTKPRPNSEMLKKNEHMSVVQKALSEGKPVPPEVLAEYPDLTPSTLPEAQSRPSQPTTQVPQNEAEALLGEGAKAKKPMVKKGDPRDKHFELLIRSKAAKDMGDGIYYFDEKFMTVARIQRLQTERDQKDVGKRVSRTDSFEFKHWSEVTGDRLARGYAILDRRARNAERANQQAATPSAPVQEKAETPAAKSQEKTDFTAEIEKIYRVLHLGPEAITMADDTNKFRNPQAEAKALLAAYKKMHKWSDEFAAEIWQKASKDMLGAKAKTVPTAPVQYTETPSAEWVQINRDKTVEANIPEAQKEKLTLKQQKEWLLVEVDKAIASGRTTGKPFEFHVPGDGHMRVAANGLASFKKRVEERFPEKSRPSALGKNPPRPVQSSKGRVNEGEYYNEWQDYEIKLDAIYKPEEKDSPFPAWDAKTGVLHNGTSMIVLPKKPMLKGLKESKADTGMFIEYSTKEISERAEIVGQFKRMGLDSDDEQKMQTGDKKTREILGIAAEKASMVFAHVRYDGKDAFFPADKIDMLRTQYPKAEIRVSKNGTQLGFFNAGRIVGVAMGFEGVELSDYHKARIKEIKAKEEGRTVPTLAANTKVEETAPKVEEVAFPVEPKPAPVQEEKVEAKAKQESAGTADAGQELTYNKRNRMTRGLKWSDLKDMNATLRTKEAVKSKIIPKPDYQAMIDEGTHPVIAHIFKQVYDFIAATPKAISRTQSEDEAIQLYIDSANRVMDEIRKWVDDGRGAEWVKSMGELMLARSGKGSISISELRQKGQAAGPYEALYPNGWREAKDEINSLGNNRYLRGIQMGEDELIKAMKDIDKGWPGTVAAWKKQGYSVAKVGEIKPRFYVGEDNKKKPYVYVHFEDGRNRFDSILVEGATSARDSSVLEAVSQGRKMYEGKFVLLSKGKRVVSAHETEADAIAAAEAVTKKKTGAGGIKEEGYSVAASSRTGVEHRMNGEDVTSEQLMAAFGFKGVNFGNWMKGKGNEAERQKHLNMAYDSFMDLAQILNVPPKAVSLNGLLGLAIGAQGTGSAAAHFVPGVNEINLTRTGGAGAVSHEWAHGLDHYFANIAGLSRSTEPFVTEHTRSSNAAIGEMRPEVMERFAEIVKAMTRTPMSRAEVEARSAAYKAKYVDYLNRSLSNMRTSYLYGITDALMVNKNGKEVNFAEEFDRIAERIKIGDVEEGKIAAGKSTALSPVVAELRDLYMLKKVGGQKVRAYNLDEFKNLQSEVDGLKYYLSEKEHSKEHEPQMRGSDYSDASVKEDRNKSGKRYWSTKLEMFARAFAGYVYDRLDAIKAKNTYLVRHDSADTTIQTAYAPIGEERKRINAAFDALLKEIKTKETDKGVALYQTASPSTPSPIDLRAAFPWADSITEQDGRTVVTKGKVSFTIELVETISPNEVAFRASYGRNRNASEQIAGEFLPGKATIRLSKVADKWTVQHEYEHFLEDMGLITPFERGVLDAAIKRDEKAGSLKFNPGVGKDRMKPAELRAYYVQNELATRDFNRKTTLGRVLQKVADFVDALANLFVRTSRGVVRDVESGAMMGRESLQADVMEGMRGFQAKEKSDTGDDMDAQKPLRLWHGSRSEDMFSRFDDRDKNFPGIWFSTKKSLADIYGEGGHVREYAVDIKNPLVMPADLPEMNGSTFATAREFVDKIKGQYGVDLSEAIGESYMESEDDIETQDFFTDDVVDALQKYGFDGISIVESGARTYAAFSPDQIAPTGEENAPQYALPTSTTEAVQKAKELKEDVLSRPETFGWLKNINTQYHKARQSPAYKRILDRVHEAAGTQGRAAARAAGLAKDILPDYAGGFMQTVRELSPFAKKKFTAADLSHVSRIMSVGTLAGADPSPFSGHRLTDANRTDYKSDAEYQAALDKTEIGRMLNGETVNVGGTDVSMSKVQVDLYRQSRAALDQMVVEMATSEAWRNIRGVLTDVTLADGSTFDSKENWRAFVENPNGADVIMDSMLKAELRKADARLTQAEMAAHAVANVDTMEDFTKYGKDLYALIKKQKDITNFTKKQIEDGDLDEITAKREEEIDAMAEKLGIDAGNAKEELKGFLKAAKEYRDAVQHKANVTEAQATVEKIFSDSTKLIDAGYTPLSRFGKYRVVVEFKDKKQLPLIKHYDTSTEAAMDRRKLERAFSGMDATVGEVKRTSEEAWRMYQGANPEALMLFAQKAGAESGELLQTYYQEALSSRSALKKLITRKGYAGYSEDLQRILASFITSGAKRVATNYHAADINEIMSDMAKQEKEGKLSGDVLDEAVNMKKFVDDPGDTGSGFRSFAANYYMLGSMMSAAWNGTQVVTSTLPELYKYSGSMSKSAMDIFKAYRSIVRKGEDYTPEEKTALKRAMQDGTVDAAENHHLYGQAIKRFINKLGNGEVARKAGAFLRLWGMPFAWFETMNRKASFIAAIRQAHDMGLDGEEAYAFAKQIVDVTQGIYQKHNRMNMARSAVGGAVLTFAQYKIMTLEQIARNAKEGGQARKAAALQLAIIAAMGGWAALPAVEDIMDLFDALMQTLGGKAWLTKKKIREAVENGSKEAAGLILEKSAADAVGQFMADFVNTGISAALPADFSARSSQGSLWPGAKLFKPSTQFRDSEIFEMAGVPGSMIQSLIDASGMILQGDMGRAAMRLAPNAVGAAIKGVDIGLTGEIKNTRGKKVTDGSPLDAALQAVGAQPKEKARINTRLRENQELKFLTQSTEKSIVAEWADAYEQKGVVAQREALVAVRKRIADWNSANPDWPIVVKQTQVMNELKNRKKTTVQLASKSAPKELRKSMAVE